MAAVVGLGASAVGVDAVADGQRLRRLTGYLQRGGILAWVTGLTFLQVKMQSFAQWAETEHQ